MVTKPGEANFFPNVPSYPDMGTFQPVYGKFDLTTYIQGASDYEIMAFLVGKYNACLEAYGTVTKLSSDTVTACKQLQDWINSWFDNLDVQQELNNKIDSMVADGSFGTLLHQTFDSQINQQTTNAVTSWLVANVTPTGSAVVVDKSLSIEGAAADAKATGLMSPRNAKWVSRDPKIEIVVDSGTISAKMDDTKELDYLDRAGLYSIAYFGAPDFTVKYNTVTPSGFGYYGVFISISSDAGTYTINVNIEPLSTNTYTTYESGTAFMWFAYNANGTINKLWSIKPADNSLSIEGATADAKATGSISPRNAKWVSRDPKIEIVVDSGTISAKMDDTKELDYLDRAGLYSIAYFGAPDFTVKYNTVTPSGFGYYGVFISISSDAGTYTINVNIEPLSTNTYTTYESGTAFMWFAYNANGTINKLWSIKPADIDNSSENHWKNKQWYAYGTSITNVASEGRYATYLASISGMTLNNRGISGGGIVSNTLIKNAIMNTTDGKLNADIITIEVGANDGSATLGDIYGTSDDTFCGALNQCIRYLQQYVPNAQIVVWRSPTTIMTTPGGEPYTPPEHKTGNDNHTQLDQADAVRRVCAVNNVKYIDMFESCGMGYYKQYYNRNLTQDGVHPSDIGGKNIAEYIWGQLKNVPLWFTSV